MIAQETCLIHGEACVHYSEKQDINCLRCLINEPIKESIIANKDSIISINKAFIEANALLISDLDRQVREGQINYERMRVKRRNVAIFGGSTTLVAFIIGFFLAP